MRDNRRRVKWKKKGRVEGKAITREKEEKIDKSGWKERKKVTKRVIKM